jgi:hypothetical protein
VGCLVVLPVLAASRAGVASDLPLQLRDKRDRFTGGLFVDLVECVA